MAARPPAQRPPLGALPPHQQKKAIFFGSAAAIVMRIGLTIIALEMLKWPFLKLVGALLLLYMVDHLFVRPDQVKAEIAGVLSLMKKAYADLGINEFRFRLSKNDEPGGATKGKYVDNPQMWESSIGMLREVLPAQVGAP